MQEIEYKGTSLSVMVAMPKTNHWIWVDWWNPLTLEFSAEALDHLIADGWVQCLSGHAYADSQLYETARLTKSETQEMITFYRPDEDKRPPIPVVLCFSVEKFASQPAPGGATIPMLNPFPPPQYGELAYVSMPYDGEQMECYHILQLPLEARQRWTRLGDKLRAISAPLLWPAFTERHALASNEAKYQRTMQSIKGKLRLAIGQARNDLIIEGAHLGAAHIHIEELRKALAKDWRGLWQDIQITARDLAHDYYTYHCSLHPIEIETKQDAGTAILEHLVPEESAKETIMQSALPFTEQIPETPAEKPPRKVRRPAQEKTRTVANRQPYIHTKTDTIVPLEIGRALQTRENFKEYPDAKQARYMHNLGKERGEIVIDIGDGKEAWATINDALNTLDDGVVDVYYAFQAIAIERNGVQHICEPILLSPDDILEICCKQKSHGSFKPNQRAEVISALKTLSLCKVKAKIPMPRSAERTTRRGRPKRGEIREGDETYIKIEGSLIDLLSFKIGEYSTITGEELWEKQSFSMGVWAKTVPGLSPSTAIMLRDILAYSGLHQRYQKRIGLYLTHMFRFNAKYGGKWPHGITRAVLLEGAGIVVTKLHRKKPGEFVASIDRAIADLIGREIVGRYWVEVDAKPERQIIEQQIDKDIRERAYGWFELWLNQKVNFEPSSAVKIHYQGLLKPAKEAPADGTV